MLKAANAQAGERVLDIGCGTGGTTAELAKAVGPNGHVLGVDISEPLVGVARAQKLGNATFEVGDATAFPIQANSVDLVFSRFGVMFFGDPMAAFTNIRRALDSASATCSSAGARPRTTLGQRLPIRARIQRLPPMERPGPRIPASCSATAPTSSAS